VVLVTRPLYNLYAHASMPGHAHWGHGLKFQEVLLSIVISMAFSPLLTSKQRYT